MQQAQKTADSFASRSFQKKIDQERERIAKRLKIPSSALEARKGKESPPAGKIYLFLSSSMPKETFRNYLLDIEKIKDSVTPIMRGMVHGLQDKKSNVRFFSEILKKDSGCWDAPKNRCKRFETDILFQPPLFTKYSVTQVPTLVYVQGQEVYKIAGDASLAYLLERINQKARRQDLKNLLGRLKNG